MKTLTISVILLLPLCLLGQGIERAGGIRLGHTSGVTYKKFMNEDEAIEMLLSGRRDGTQFTALYEFHSPLEISFDKNFFVYYGVGGHIGYENYDDLKKVLISEDPVAFEFEEKNYFVMGFDLMAGVEYRYLSAPITIAFEIKPYFNFIGMRHTKSHFWDAGLSFKYLF